MTLAASKTAAAAHILPDQSLDVLFRQARTYNAWKKDPVTDTTIQALYELLKWGPTSANASPARFLFLKSPAAKEKLKPFLAPGNLDKTMAAPVVAVIAQDMKFYDHLPKLFPHADARSWFVGNDALIEQTAFRNSALQGAYLMMAARALGLDCGPMSGFDADGLKAAFFPDEDVRPNFLCNLGYGDPEGLHPRGPRLSFDEACRIL